MAKGILHLNVEFSAVKDEEGRFARLATLLGLADADHARGKCEHLWVACTRRGETDLPQWLVEQVLGERGPDALVEAELAGWAGGRGDSKTRRMRIAGAQKHCMWMASDQGAKSEQSSKGGKTRAANASRAGGRFTSDSPATPPAQTSPSEITTAAELEEDQDAPVLPRDPAVGAPVQPEVPPSAPMPVPAPVLRGSQDLADRRRRLIAKAWQLAGEAFRRVQDSGIDPSAPNGWAGLPAADDPPMVNLRKIIDGMLIGERPDYERAEARIANRIAVAEAEARAKSPPTTRWMTPARMWNRDSFSIAVDESPEQAAAAHAPRGSRAGPRGSAERAPKRDVRVGRIEPSDPSAYVPTPDEEMPF